MPDSPPPSPSTSLRDVALLAGVSAMTASRALSGRVKVSEDKQKAVFAAAEHLGYELSPLVRTVMSGLRRRQSSTFRGTLAFLNTSNDKEAWHSLPYNLEYLEGARAQAAASGFSLDEIWVEDKGWTPQRTRKVLMARGVQGLLIPPGGNPEQVEFDLSGFALASFGGLAFDFPVHQALPDYFHNYSTCFERLWELGYRRIGLFTPEYDLRISGQEIVGGFLAAQWRQPRKCHVPVGHHDGAWQSAKEDFIRWFRRHKPEAVIIHYHPARGWIESLGLKIPQDVGVAHPGLADDVKGWSGINVQRPLQAAHAIDFLTAQILRNESGFPKEPKRIIIGGLWVQGKTSPRLKSALP